MPSRVFSRLELRRALTSMRPFHLGGCTKPNGTFSRQGGWVGKNLAVLGKHKVGYRAWESRLVGHESNGRRLDLRLRVPSFWKR